MSFETYNIYFSGNIMKGQNPEEVRKKIGTLFKLDGAKLDRLFSGQPMPIKKNINMDQAVKYRLAFREAGALLDIRPAGIDQPPPASSPRPGRAPETQESLTLSPPNNFDLSDCTVPVTPQEIPDISDLTLDTPGSILDEGDSVEPLEIDTDALELAKSGMTLDQAVPQPAVDIDTSTLELDPANQGSLEEYRQTLDPVPLPDIDHLNLAEREEKPRGKAKFDISED